MINNSGATPPRAPASCSIWLRDGGGTGGSSPRAARQRVNASWEVAPPLPRGPPGSACRCLEHPPRGCAWRAAVAGRAAVSTGPGRTVLRGGTVAALPGVRRCSPRPGGTTHSHPVTGACGWAPSPAPALRAAHTPALGPPRETRALLQRVLTGLARFGFLRSILPSSGCLCLFPFHKMMK